MTAVMTAAGAMAVLRAAASAAPAATAGRGVSDEIAAAAAQRPHSRSFPAVADRRAFIGAVLRAAVGVVGSIVPLAAPGIKHPFGFPHSFVCAKPWRRRRARRRARGHRLVDATLEHGAGEGEARPHRWGRGDDALAAASPRSDVHRARRPPWSCRSRISTARLGFLASRLVHTPRRRAAATACWNCAHPPHTHLDHHVGPQEEGRPRGRLHGARGPRRRRERRRLAAVQPSALSCCRSTTRVAAAQGAGAPPAHGHAELVQGSRRASCSASTTSRCGS